MGGELGGGLGVGLKSGRMVRSWGWGRWERWSWGAGMAREVACEVTGRGRLVGRRPRSCVFACELGVMGRGAAALLRCNRAGGEQNPVRGGAFVDRGNPRGGAEKPVRGDRGGRQRSHARVDQASRHALGAFSFAGTGAT